MTSCSIGRNSDRIVNGSAVTLSCSLLNSKSSSLRLACGSVPPLERVLIPPHIDGVATARSCRRRSDVACSAAFWYRCSNVASQSAGARSDKKEQAHELFDRSTRQD